MNPIRMTVLALAAALLVGCDGASSAPKTAAPAAPHSGGLSASELAAEPTPGSDYKTIDWDALIPPAWNPASLLSDANVDAISDDSRQGKALMKKLKALWKEAPIVPELNGRKVQLPGFVVPLDMDAQSIGEFLLVPYYGACIHVPPPPRNQTVYVVTAKGHEYRGEVGVMDAVLVTGTLKIETQSTDMGDSGYRIDAVKVEPYEPPEDEGAQ